MGSYMIHTVFSFLLLLMLLSCNRQQAHKSDLFEKAEIRGRVPTKIEEASGLVASVANPGYLWTHNDSGNPAEVFLLNDKAEIVMTCKLENAKNRDWEDLTLGQVPGEEGYYLYIGDIGDNDAKYPLKYIYRFAEPVYTGDDKISIEKFDTLIIQLPDGARDAESLATDHKTGDLYLISKREEIVNVYWMPEASLIAGDTLVPEKITVLPYRNIVAADFSFSGNELLIKTYNEILYWSLSDSTTIMQALKTEPVYLTYKPEPQGEAIAWSLDFTGFYTLSESVHGERAKLYYYKRR